MSSKGKKYVDSVKRYDMTRVYAPTEALELVRSLAHASFDETVELAVRLGIDPRKADQVVRGTVPGKVFSVSVMVIRPSPPLPV